MKKWFVITMMLALITCIKVYAAPNQTESNLIIKSVNHTELYGEIISIEPQQLVLSCANGNFNIKINSDTCIFCNGMSGNWNALRPVSKNAFFEAKVIVNIKNEAIMINADYFGDEYIIKRWKTVHGNLRLSLVNPNTDKEKDYPVASSAKLPDSKWLEENQIIYVLYNLSGEIRAIYLPDLNR